MELYTRNGDLLIRLERTAFRTSSHNYIFIWVIDNIQTCSQIKINVSMKIRYHPYCLSLHQNKELKLYIRANYK